MIMSLDTGKIFIANAVIANIKILLSNASKKAANPYWNKTASALRFCSSYLQYTIFAKDSVENGILPTISSIVAGAAAQGAVEILSASP